MTVVLDLAPEVEASLQAGAAAEGETLSEFVSRLLVRYQIGSALPKAEPAWKAKLRAGQEVARREFAALGMTDDQLSEEIETAIRAYRAERVVAENAG